ncbi:MAG: hypothetical protein AB1Y26_07065 [Cycloclasticus sp.]
MTESKFSGLVKVIAIFVVLCVCGVIFIYMYQFSISKGYGLGGTTAFGEFGDYIGGILNPILGFATVILLIFSIHIQMKELGDSTKALQASQAAMEAQVETSKNELNLIKAGQLAQQKALKDDLYLSQLNENAERIIKTFDELINHDYLNFNHIQYSLYDLLYNVTHLDKSTIEHNLARIKVLMESSPAEHIDKVKKIQLNSIKNNMNLLLMIFQELKPKLASTILQKAWEERLLSRAQDCFGLMIYSESELNLTMEMIKSPSTAAPV